jgi:hypothetical protein
MDLQVCNVSIGFLSSEAARHSDLLSSFLEAVDEGWSSSCTVVPVPGATLAHVPALRALMSFLEESARVARERPWLSLYNREIQRPIRNRHLGPVVLADAGAGCRNPRLAVWQILVALGFPKWCARFILEVPLSLMADVCLVSEMLRVPCLITLCSARVAAATFVVSTAAAACRKAEEAEAEEKEAKGKGKGTGKAEKETVDSRASDFSSVRAQFLAAKAQSDGCNKREEGRVMPGLPLPCLSPAHLKARHLWAWRYPVSAWEGPCVLPLPLGSTPF